MRKKPLYKVTFLNQGKSYELYARSVHSSDLWGFTTVSDLVFEEASSLIVDPSEEKLRDERFDVYGWQAMFRWVNDGVSFPSGCYRQWIGEFYQSNKLVRGQLVMNGRKVLLSNIRCPLLNVVASNDVIAPRPTTSAILGLVSSTDKAELVVKGGHVGIVVGKAAATDLWPKVGAWLAARDA